MDLFPPSHVVGVFRGFREGGLEFHADLVLPYRSDFQSIPMHGQFLLVQLETPDEAVLGRIASFSSDGKLAYGTGEEFNIRAVQEGRAVPEDLRQQYLRYRINIRVLGVLRRQDSSLTFVASHRRLPHVGSPVALPSKEVLREIAGHNEGGATIGYFALGEYIYGDRANLDVEPWMQLAEPSVEVHFAIENLVSRRTFVFARAGFGKSNLNKLLFSHLYRSMPTITKRGGRKVPVGTILFDPDGEYFWPDDRGRPGLCDVEALKDNVVVFTSRRAPSPFYSSFVAGDIRLDLRRLTPSDVISLTLSPEKQAQQNVAKLRGLSPSAWSDMVNLIADKGNQAPLEQIQRLMNLEQSQEVEALAARSNMTTIVGLLHDSGSQLMDLLLEALGKGKLCIVDVSQMRNSQAFMLSALILRKIFSKNQEEFTNKDPATIPTLAVMEEAQSVLNEGNTSAEPFIAWVKEGRKYDLGAVMITQQPGSIPNDLLSQGDNWFLFHLLSAADLTNVKRANAHFSDDLLSVLLNEPIPGNGVFWSSVAGKPYPISIRAQSFERLYNQLDPNYNLPAVECYATDLRNDFHERKAALVSKLLQGADGSTADASPERGEPDNVAQADTLSLIRDIAAEALQADADLMQDLRSEEGVPWGRLNAFIEELIPEGTDDAHQLAYQSVRPMMDKLFGSQDTGWIAYTPEGKRSKYVKVATQT